MVISLNSSEMNLNLFLRKASEIREAIKDIRNYTANNENEFLKNTQLIDATKYKFIVAIEACMAICNHIISRAGNRVPESYSECFQILQELTIISEKVSKNLIKMAKFRNLLTHIYWTIDDKKVLKYARNYLDDFEKYLMEIGDYLKNETKLS